MALDPSDVGGRIREARIAHGWTHEELARRMNVNWRTVQRWQKGKLPRTSELIRLADVLEVPQTFLLESDDARATIEDVRAKLDALTERVERLAAAVEGLAALEDGKRSSGS